MPIIGQSQVIRPYWYDRLTNAVQLTASGSISGETVNVVLDSYTIPANTLAIIVSGSLSLWRDVNGTTILGTQISLTLNSAASLVDTIFLLAGVIQVKGQLGSNDNMAYSGGGLIEPGNVLRLIISNLDIGGSVFYGAGVLINEFSV